jgi:PII-like signaling protein
MRILNGQQVLVRIFIGESDKWHHRPLHQALLERLRREGFAGATVFRGLSGFGAHSVVHTTKILRLSEDLPILIEVVESEDRMALLTGILDEMVPEGLVTMENVRVLKYAPGTADPSAAPAAPPSPEHRAGEEGEEAPGPRDPVPPGDGAEPE